MFSWVHAYTQIYILLSKNIFIRKKISKHIKITVIKEFFLYKNNSLIDIYQSISNNKLYNIYIYIYPKKK